MIHCARARKKGTIIQVIKASMVRKFLEEVFSAGVEAAD
jgi:hypothetical protein